MVDRYYDSKGHQRKNISSSGAVSELKRDIHGLIAAKTNFNIGEVTNYGGETFLSEEVAISLLQETKEALRRCQVLSKQTDQASNAEEIWNLLVSYLLHNHVDYALELGLSGLRTSELRTPSCLLGLAELAMEKTPESACEAGESLLLFSRGDSKISKNQF